MPYLRALRIASVLQRFGRKAQSVFPILLHRWQRDIATPRYSIFNGVNKVPRYLTINIKTAGPDWFKTCR